MSLTHKPYRFNSHFEIFFFLKKKKTEKKCITYLNYLVMIFVSSTIDGSIIYVLFCFVWTVLSQTVFLSCFCIGQN
jgi:hypothetical protein